jgi:hypothetical protein
MGPADPRPRFHIDFTDGSFGEWPLSEDSHPTMENGFLVMTEVDTYGTQYQHIIPAGSIRYMRTVVPKA